MDLDNQNSNSAAVILQEHPALKDPDCWTYLNEGSNNVILGYTGSYDEIMSQFVLRIKKINNSEYYNSPIQMPEQEYNPIMAENVFQKDPFLKKHLESMKVVNLDKTFLQGIEDKISFREIPKVKTISKIDVKTNVGMLVTNFSSFPQLTDGNQEILGFEIKPKSCVTEYVPSSVLQHVSKNSDRLHNFLSKEISVRFLNHQITKFEVMQISRKFSGKLKEISKYDPHQFFNVEGEEGVTEKALKVLACNQNQVYSKMYINGIRVKDISDEKIEMIAHFLKESGIIQSLYKYQHFSLSSLEKISNLYSLLLPELQDPATREKHFNLIRDYFKTFEFETHYPLSNQIYEVSSIDPDYKALWSIILSYLISATVKDFTIMMRITKEEYKQKKIQKQEVDRDDEEEMEWKSQLYRVCIGVIDLDSKLYSKIPSYMKESEQDYMNFVNYHNL